MTAVLDEPAPISIGDVVSWQTATGYKTGGTVIARDDKTATVQTLGQVRHSQFGRTRIALAKLTKENPL